MITEDPTCQRGLCWGWVLLLLHSPEAEPHNLSAMDFPCKCQVKGAHRVYQVFSDPMGSNRHSVEGIDWDPCGEKLILLSLETFKNT